MEGRDLCVEKLSRSMGELELRADFRVPAGRRVGLSGRSGSGKTSLLRAIAGLDPCTGSIRLGSREISELPPEKRGIGYVFQEPALFPALSVWENATFALKVRGLAKSERRALAEEWLSRVGLGRHLDSKVDRLSGGEKQRVALVRATIWKPELLLLDEPFSALDPELRRDLGAVVIELHEKTGAPLLIVTHDETDMEMLVHSRLEVRPKGGRQLLVVF